MIFIQKGSDSQDGLKCKFPIAMKKKEDFIKNLDLFGESYTINNNTVLLNTGTPLRISVTFEEAKYSIEGKLIRWNFSTGMLKM